MSRPSKKRPSPNFLSWVDKLTYIYDHGMVDEVAKAIGHLLVVYDDLMKRTGKQPKKTKEPRPATSPRRIWGL